MRTLVLLLLFSISLSSQNLPSYVSSNSLERWYPFNGNANNVSSSSGNGITINATLTTDRFGSVNSAYSFSNQGYIQTSTLGQISSTSLTMSCWVNPNSTQIGGWNGVVSNQQSSSSGFLFQLTGTNQPWVTTAYSSGGYNNLSNSSALNSGWTHIVQVIKPGLMELYINGIKTDSTTTSSYAIHNTSALYIGTRLFGSSSYENYSGSVDDVGIWSRALTVQEIQDLYVGCADTIQQQPQSNTFYTVPGDAYFAVTHSDTAATFQWQLNTGTGWSNLSDLGIYSGTTTDSVILTGITLSLNNYGFRCLINSHYMDTTDLATLTVVDNIGINEIVKDIIVSPNPTYGLLNIVLTSSAEYEVFNINGQRVAQGKTEGQIDITNLPTGSYQLIINNDDGRSTHTIQKI